VSGIRDQRGQAAVETVAIGADREAAARRALPPRLEHGLRVAAQDGGVAVRVRIPMVVGGARLGTTTARAHLRDQGG